MKPDARTHKLHLLRQIALIVGGLVIVAGMGIGYLVATSSHVLSDQQAAETGIHFLVFALVFIPLLVLGLGIIGTAEVVRMILLMKYQLQDEQQALKASQNGTPARNKIYEEVA